MKPRHLVVLGGGVSSEVFLFYFLQNLIQFPLTAPIKITQIFNDALFPSYSQKSTAFVCPRGIKKGLSPLGDQLHDAYHEVEYFFNHFAPKGVTLGKIEHFPGEDDVSLQRFLRRYGSTSKVIEDCFYFSPDNFLEWIRQQNDQLKEFGEFQRVQAEIIAVNEDHLVCADQQSIFFDHLLLGPGTYSKMQEERYPPIDILKKSQVVSGCYYTFKEDLGEVSFGHTFTEGYCLYRSDSKELILGSTSTKQNIDGTPPPKECPLQVIYHQVERNLNRLKLTHFSLPPRNKGMITMGQRHKYYRKRPFWGTPFSNQNINMVLGLYKNGYSLSFLAAKELSASVHRQLFH